jgi:hypothetical protein
MVCPLYSASSCSKEGNNTKKRRRRAKNCISSFRRRTTRKMKGTALASWWDYWSTLRLLRRLEG